MVRSGDEVARNGARGLRLSLVLAQLCLPEVGEDAASAAAPANSPDAAAGSEAAGASGVGAARPPLRQRLRTRSHLSIDELMRRTSKSGFGFLIGFLALAAVPFVGLSSPFGIAIAVGAAQMAIGLPRPWMPGWIRRRRLSIATLEWLSVRVSRWTAGLERVIRPRFALLLQGPFWVICGLAIMTHGLALALPLPIPGSNWIFIAPILLYAIGVLEGDGLLIMLCHALTAAEIVACVWMWDAVAAALHKAFSYFAG